MNQDTTRSQSDRSWLKRYYAVRALFSFAWVALAFTLGRSLPGFGSVLLAIYPTWDSLANFYDAKRSGGLRANPTQTGNMATSAAVALAVGLFAPTDPHAAIGVIGGWATLSGLLQLATAVRRWRGASAQWPMILSGAQSTLAGGAFVKLAGNATAHPGAVDVAPYAAFGAFYFLVSTISLIVSDLRHSNPA
ncbi:DUF308 domain-containing protein [Novosphingobium sp. JCM 18896]|uniref:DUF308 domain-containing protein n=1 Tax=Novosphingobium sp. JCM 18896 TaxID=2989731 RepID=UPI002221C365|nr:DUF308 domain-containing protein [Novosphingobium sp. JCM 18896]MCW1430123.1 DUF308 domain-containing protein [Novosphingobium sp. JCM 18896]